MRRFSEHETRVVHDLCGVFDFAFLGDVDPDAVDITCLQFDDRMMVPGCFDALPRYAGRRGLVAYRTALPKLSKPRGRLVVGAAHHYCRSFVNGEAIGEHAGGFTRFFHDFVVPRAEGKAELCMLVDNRFEPERSPLHHVRYDWYQYGGITRGLELHELGAVALGHLEVTTERLSPPRIRLRVVYTAFAADRLPLRISVEERVVHQGSVAVALGDASLEFLFDLPEVELWSPNAPHLYSLRVCLGDDDLITRFGVRSIEARDRALWLNGKRLQLSGVNRHEAHPAFGHAVPLAVQLADLQLCEELGANAVRGSHYPQDPLFLDVCDEQGMLVYNEAIGWQQTEEELADEAFLMNLEQHVDEMLAMSLSHPCIVAWGFLNEGASHCPTARGAYQRIARRFKERDPSRPVTFASNRHGSDLCLDLVDFVSVNLYPGWYFGSLASIPEELERLLELYRMQAPDLPLLVSEVGAGALYGCHDTHAGRWTEEYQAALLDRVLTATLDSASGLCGVLLWQFCDCRTSDAVEHVMGRPRGFNNKGLLDEYRRPKLAWRTVKEHFRPW